jgi:exosome complex component CSL4
MVWYHNSPKNQESTTTMTTNPLGKKLGSTVTPGDRLGNIIALRNKGTLLIAGEGTYIRHGHLHASITGQVMATIQDDDNDNDDAMTTDSDNNSSLSKKWIVSIQQSQQQKSQSAYAKASSGICPQEGSVVLGRVTRVVRPSYANVDIIAIVPSSENEQKDRQQGQQRKPYLIPFHEPYAATLRQNEIRPQSAIELEISDCIRPGDVILARIHALGGEKEYILSTAEAEFGVVKATCESSGYDLVPVSYKEMECPVTKVKEGRKVAKPRDR